MSKFIASLAVSGLVALSLVACSTPADPTCDATAPGASSKKVEVSGSTDAEPKVKFKSPLDATKTERSVIVTGTGGVVEPGMLATFGYVVYNAATGDKLGGTFEKHEPVSIVLDAAHVLPGMLKTVECSTVGSRIVGVVPPADAFGADGPNVGVGVTDSLIFVFDIKKVESAPTEPPSPTPNAAQLPVPEEWKDNIPTVNLDGATPVVTLPKTDPSTLFELKVITPGDGAEVTAASTVTIDYQGTSWSTGEVFGQSYDSGAPITEQVARFVPGFSAAMVGQKAGATILVTVPPKYAYGTDTSASPLAGQTLVFLIQIHKVA